MFSIIHTFLTAAPTAHIARCVPHSHFQARRALNPSRSRADELERKLQSAVERSEKDNSERDQIEERLQGELCDHRHRIVQLEQEMLDIKAAHDKQLLNLQEDIVLSIQTMFRNRD
jgi:hypothetical protein